MNYNFKGILTLTEWVKSKGKRFRSQSPRARRYQSLKYHKEYFYPLTKKREIPLFPALFWSTFGEELTLVLEQSPLTTLVEKK